jgi:hypothetical protein
MPSPSVSLKVTSLTRSKWRLVFGDRFSGSNSSRKSESCEAVFGFTRPVRYLRAFPVLRAIFRCACRHRSEQNLCGLPRFVSGTGSLQHSHHFTKASITRPPWLHRATSLDLDRRLCLNRGCLFFLDTSLRRRSLHERRSHLGVLQLGVFG